MMRSGSPYRDGGASTSTSDDDDDDDDDDEYDLTKGDNSPYKFLKIAPPPSRYVTNA